MRPLLALLALPPLRAGLRTTILGQAGTGGAIIALNCRHDDPLYIAIWYPIGCGLVAITARLLPPRVARW